MKMRSYALLIGAAILIVMMTACSKTKVEDSIGLTQSKPLLEQAKDKARDAYEEESPDFALIQFKEALDLFVEAMPTATESDSIDVVINELHFQIADTYMNLANEDLEIEMYDEAIMNMRNALDYYDRLDASIMESEYNVNKEDAIKSLLIRIARAQTSATHYEDALITYDEVLEKDPGNEEALTNQYIILSENIQDEERAFTVLKEYAELSNDYKVYMILGNSYNEKNNYAEAVKYYEKALELEESPEVLNRLSSFYRDNKKWADSNRILTKLIETKPDDATLASIYRLMGSNYEELKNNAKKIEFWEKSLGLERNTQLALAVASHYHTAKNYAKAITFATQTLQLDPNNVDAYLIRGDSYYRTKKYTEAKADLQRIENDPRRGATAKQLLKAIK
ncbi:MAG: tetratricopeptide repeat protein [Candidatus Cloacimonetes bacterium]|nr:tetratricopeptide repeat protein [Candidatus Cloacimonadota bacterium]